MSVSRPAAAGDNAADPRSDRNLAQTSERCRSFFGASAAAAAITRSARRNSRLVNDTAAAAFLDALRAIDRSKDYTRRNGSRSDRDFHSMMTNSFVPCMQLALCFLSFRQIQSAAKTPLCQNCERPKKYPPVSSVGSYGHYSQFRKSIFHVSLPRSAFLSAEGRQLPYGAGRWRRRRRRRPTTPEPVTNSTVRKAMFVCD